MNDDLHEFTKRLNTVLAEETGLLEALHHAAAADLLPRKQDAVAALQGAITAGVSAGDMDEDQMAAFREDAQILARLVEDNRQAIERALALQTELIQTIAQAVPRVTAPAPAYQSDGAEATDRTSKPYSFQSEM